MARIIKNLRHVIEIIGRDPLSWGVGGGGVNSEKLEKLRYC